MSSRTTHYLCNTAGDVGFACTLILVLAPSPGFEPEFQASEARVLSRLDYESTVKVMQGNLKQVLRLLAPPTGFEPISQAPQARVLSKLYYGSTIIRDTF